MGAEEPLSGWSRITGGVGGDIQNDQDNSNDDNGNLQVELFKSVTASSRALSFSDVKTFYKPDNTVEVKSDLVPVSHRSL